VFADTEITLKMDESDDDLSEAHHEEEEPPFALVDQNSPQHLFANQKEEFRSPPATSGFQNTKSRIRTFGDSQISCSSSPPGLVESQMGSSTEGSQSSTQSPCELSAVLSQQLASQYQDASSTFLMSSLATVTSTMGESSNLPDSRVFGQHDLNTGLPNGQSSMSIDVSRASVGFSQLFKAADDTNDNFKSKMHAVPEEEQMSPTEGTFQSLGTLISVSPQMEEKTREGIEGGWFPNFLSLRQTQERSLNASLMASSPSSMSAPLLSYSPSSMSIKQARSGIRTCILDDKSFEISMNVEPPCTAQDVMGVIGNPNLLKLWCDPIHALVITSSSEGAHDAANRSDSSPGRQYEGEWIEATTGSLTSPPGYASYVYGGSKLVMENLGFCSYGKVTMFVERPRGQVGLTVGPFIGGVTISHTISVHEDDNRIRIVDRVRLNTEEDDFMLASLFLCDALDSLSRCLLPSVSDYLEQATASMALLRMLLEDGEAGRHLERMGSR
jgi:hypothetical protein